ncbi:unnamed protein product [Caenorhabditis brenneri]
MESPDPLPSKLLTLPADIQLEIFSYLSPIDIAIFSFCSKETYQIAKNVKKSSKLTVEISQGNTGRFKISYPTFGNHFTFLVENNKKMGHRIRKNFNQVFEKQSGRFVMRNERYVDTYWDDEHYGMTEIVKHLMDVFGFLQISTVHVSTDCLNRGLLDWISGEYKGGVSQMSIDSTRTNTSEETMTYLLNFAKATQKHLTFYSDPSPDLSYRFNYDLESFRIESAKWIKLDHLMDLCHQVKDLTILNCSDLDLNGFLKEWVKRGENLKLKHLTISQKWDMDELLAGIEHEKLDDHVENVFQTPTGRMNTKGGYVVERHT